MLNRSNKYSFSAYKEQMYGSYNGTISYSKFLIKNKCILNSKTKINLDQKSEKSKRKVKSYKRSQENTIRKRNKSPKA